MIAVSEGTAGIPSGDNGYRVKVGSTPSNPRLFFDYSDHPRELYRPCNSTAAGRYQIIAKYYDAYKASLCLPDFSPASQDAIATQMIKECRAVPDIESGDIAAAINKCRSRWASFPNAGYGQHEQSLATLLDAYAKAGGGGVTCC